MSETEAHATLTDILRQIVAKTDGGPGECIGHEADGRTVWKGSFRSLLWEAHDAILAVQNGVQAQVSTSDALSAVAAPVVAE
jgi:hypothetical protein